MPNICHSLSTATAAAPDRLRSSGAAKYAYALLCGLSLALGASTAPAEELSVEQMVCALNPQCAMPLAARQVRGITATASAIRPGSFDQTVNFAFNSADLTPDARRQLDKVAEALTDPRIEKSTIIIHGHTDAVGNPRYNLSQLLLPNDPDNDLNRRVQFENPHYAEAAAASRPAPGPKPATRPAKSDSPAANDGL
jgi:hypothetical protein